jgi:hypothetical protein
MHSANKTQKIIFLVIISLFSLKSFAQRGFYKNDSIAKIGVKIVDGGKISNAQWCIEDRKDSLLSFSPYEVSKYGFNKGKTYVSKDITFSGATKRVFLEQLNEGKINLYFYAEQKLVTYFIEKDSTTFLELPKENENSNFQKQLQELTSDFPEFSNSTSLVKYNRTALSRFVNDYNQQLNRPFPHFRFGITGIYEMTKFSLTSDQNIPSLDKIPFSYESSFSGGLFIDVPLLVSYFSLHPEIQYSQYSYSYFAKTDDKDIDFLANISSIKVPVLFRYTFPSNNIRPFANAGGIVAYNIRNENTLYETTFTGNQIEINNLGENPLIPAFQAGFSAGLGVEFKINFQHSLFFEIRYNQFINGQLSNSLRSTDLQFITSFNF